MRVAVLGVNHKLADILIREKLARSCQNRFASPHSWYTGLQCVLISTCNRTELYFNANSLSEAHSYILNILRGDVGVEFDQKLYTYFGGDCFNHLCRVTAGLDSAIIGETAIQGQVKSAYCSASSHYSLTTDLHYLFQKALSISKKVRSNFSLYAATSNIATAIYNCGIAHLKKPEDAKVLIIGASEVNQKVICLFKKRAVKNITLCNRTLKTAEQLACTFGLKVLPWQQRDLWNYFDWIVIGTKAEEHIITANHSPGNAKLIVDLSVPRNVDPSLSKVLPLFNIDQINKGFNDVKEQLPTLLTIAEEQINSATERHLKIFRNKIEKIFLQSAIA